MRCIVSEFETVEDRSMIADVAFVLFMAFVLLTLAVPQ
jgi:hypothetical protein